MKNEEQVQWSVLTRNVKILRLALQIHYDMDQYYDRCIVVVRSFPSGLFDSFLQGSWNDEAL